RVGRLCADAAESSGRAGRARPAAPQRERRRDRARPSARRDRNAAGADGPARAQATRRRDRARDPLRRRGPGRRAGARGRMSASAFELVREGDLLRLRFDLPGEKVNLLRAATMDELEARLGEARAMSGVRALLIESGKATTFIAGADVNA